MFRRLAGWDRYHIGDTYAAANEGLEGRLVADIARERGVDAFATLLDIVHQRRAAHRAVAGAARRRRRELAPARRGAGTPATP